MSRNRTETNPIEIQSGGFASMGIFVGETGDFLLEQAPWTGIIKERETKGENLEETDLKWIFSKYMYVKYIRVYYFNLFIFIRLVSAIFFKVYLYVGGHNLFWNFFTRSISTAKGSQIRYTLFQKRWRRDLWRSRATIGLRKIQSWQYWLERRPMCIENCTKDNGSPIVAKLGLDQSSFVHLVYEITTLKF